MCESVCEVVDSSGCNLITSSNVILMHNQSKTVDL